MPCVPGALAGLVDLSRSGPGTLPRPVPRHPVLALPTATAQSDRPRPVHLRSLPGVRCSGRVVASAPTQRKRKESSQSSRPAGMGRRGSPCYHYPSCRERLSRTKSRGTLSGACRQGVQVVDSARVGPIAKFHPRSSTTSGWFPSNYPVQGTTKRTRVSNGVGCGILRPDLLLCVHFVRILSVYSPESAPRSGLSL